MIQTSTRKNNKQFEKIETNDIDNIDDEEEYDDDKVSTNNTKTFKKKKCALFLILIMILILCAGVVIGYITRTMFDEDNISWTNKYDADNYYIRDPECLDRKCCKSIDIGNNSANTECADFSLFECIFDAAWCEWDCDYTHRKAENSSYVAMTRRQRVFHGISTGIGKYREGTGGYPGAGTLNEDGNNDGYSFPSSPYEVMQRSKMISIDDCGVMYEEIILDYTSAEKEYFRYLNESHNDDGDKLDGDDGERRRMQSNGPTGLIGSDDQVGIGQSSGGSLSYPDNTVGCITYYADDEADNGDGYDSSNQYYYNKICTGTVLSPWHILTAAHCCYPYLGHNFYANWYYYPKIAYYSQLYSYRYPRGFRYEKAYKVRYARIYSEWRDQGYYEYNYCILTLYWPYWHYYNNQLTYIQIGYDIHTYLSSVQLLSTHSYFSTAGYRYDKYSSNINNGYLIYGWKNKYITGYSDNYLTFTSSAYHHGFGGAPLYYNYNQINKVYCIVSQFGYTQNTCVRITHLVYTQFCSIIGEYNTGYSKYNQYCISV